MLIDKIHRSNFLSFEEYIDFTVRYTYSILGRFLTKSKYCEKKTNCFLLDNDIENFKEIKAFLEKNGINVEKQVLF